MTVAHDARLGHAAAGRRSQVFAWMVDADFGVINWLIDQIPGRRLQQAQLVRRRRPRAGASSPRWSSGGLPFLAITLYAGLSQVPPELSEAATVDGANAWQVFRAVTLPILRPLLGIVTTLSVIWNFQVFTQVWVLRYGKPEQEYQTLTTYAYGPGLQQRQVRVRLGRLDRHGPADARRDGLLHPADVQDRRRGLMVSIDVVVPTVEAGHRPREPPGRPSQPPSRRHHGREHGRGRLRGRDGLPGLLDDQYGVQAAERGAHLHPALPARAPDVRQLPVRGEGAAVPDRPAQQPHHHDLGGGRPRSWSASSARSRWPGSASTAAGR